MHDRARGPGCEPATPCGMRRAVTCPGSVRPQSKTVLMCFTDHICADKLFGALVRLYCRWDTKKGNVDGSSHIARVDDCELHGQHVLPAASVQMASRNCGSKRGLMWQSHPWTMQGAFSLNSIVSRYELRSCKQLSPKDCLSCCKSVQVMAPESCATTPCSPRAMWSARTPCKCSLSGSASLSNTSTKTC